MDNSNNKKWWDDHTMSYKDWDLDEKHRSKESHEAIIEVNKKNISSNPFLEYFFADIKNEKKNNKLKFDKVLDIGCGWGTSSIFLSNLFSEVHAIDISSTSVSKAKINIDLQKKK